MTGRLARVHDPAWPHDPDFPDVDPVTGDEAETEELPEESHMTCSQCDDSLTADAPAVLYDRVEHRFCSVTCMTQWVIDLEWNLPLPAGTNRIYWRSIDLSTIGGSS